MKKVCLAICLASTIVATPAYARGEGLGDRCAWVDARDGKYTGLCWWFANLENYYGWLYR